jgi:purine-nucleoside/S-methyl-5'-thioadenosine phosphorylase / adenosine deaminase
MTLHAIQPDWEAPDQVQALSTTRNGGVSVGCYASLNMGAHTDDQGDAVAENRRRVGEMLPARPTWMNQIHGDQFIELPCADGMEADAALTRVPGSICAVMTADCLPLLLCAADASVVAAVHCGWRGLAAGVIDRTLEAMACADIMAWLGPAIGSHAYQIETDLAERLQREARAPSDAFCDDGPGKKRCDLYRIASAQLASAGVTRVSGGDRCTFSEPETFFSHRRDGQTGRQATMIWIEE